MTAIGALTGLPPIDSKNVAVPKANTPPSDATSQYPWSSGVPAMPATGALRAVPLIEPVNTAVPRVNTPPSDATSQPFAAAVLPRAPSPRGKGARQGHARTPQRGGFAMVRGCPGLPAAADLCRRSDQGRCARPRSEVTRHPGRPGAQLPQDALRYQETSCATAVRLLRWPRIAVG